MLAALEGHMGAIYGALALADGRLLSWADDTSLRLWSAAGEPLMVLEGHTDEVTGALPLADGRLLSWADDGTLRLWSATGEGLAVSDNSQALLPDFLAAQGIAATLMDILRAQGRACFTRDSAYGAAWEGNVIGLYKAGISTPIASFYGDSRIIRATFFDNDKKLAVICRGGWLIFFAVGM
jgi:WD40 repeat protein